MNFILIDDDPFSNTICRMVLKRTFTDLNIKDFTSPEDGLEYLASGAEKGNDIILLLDINMPTMSGWEFLEEFDLLSEEIKQNVKVYILSSSIDERDKIQASKNKYVIDYLLKPLKTENIARIGNLQ